MGVDREPQGAGADIGRSRRGKRLQSRGKRTMGVHRLFERDWLPGLGTWLSLAERAHHAARVKRVEVGERVQVLNGAGLLADGEVAGRSERARRVGSGGGACSLRAGGGGGEPTG